MTHKIFNLANNNLTTMLGKLELKLHEMFATVVQM